jgi:hypothetical protein
MENELERLKQRAELLGRYYCKGLGACLCFVTDCIDGLMNHFDPDTAKKEIEDANFGFSKIKDFYSKIPFDELKTRNDEVFFPLFIARDFLKLYEKNMEESFRLVPKQYIAANARNYNISINLVGQIYREHFAKALKDVRHTSGGEKFRVRLVDLSGRVWNIGAI